jgi:hypothetical protein
MGDTHNHEYNTHRRGKGTMCSDAHLAILENTFEYRTVRLSRDA